MREFFGMVLVGLFISLFLFPERTASGIHDLINRVQAGWQVVEVGK